MKRGFMRRLIMQRDAKTARIVRRRSAFLPAL
jgi:hypothetical protein